MTYSDIDNIAGDKAGSMLSDFLQAFEDDIITEWVLRLHTECGPQYADRPVEELNETVSDAYYANYAVLVYDNFLPINTFIDKITRMRLESGFLLSDVQKAFELFRCIVIPRLIERFSPEHLQIFIPEIDRCLAYTIHRFSDLFQNMHEKKILDQNRRLEEMVQLRTAALEESERKYKTLVEEINDGYFVIQNENIVFANPAFCQMHGYQNGRVIGRKFTHFVAPVDRRRVLDNYNQSLSGKVVPRVFEYMRLTREGDIYPTEIQAKLTRYDNRLSSIGICRDITERVKMEKKVRENERMAYIGQIATSLSHEIRNPLSAVKLNLQILKKNTQIKGNDQRRITISVNEVIRLERILNQLLDFAKPVQLDLSPCKLEDILMNFAELLEIKFSEKNLDLITDFERQMPSVVADSEKIGQAFINMLLNAIEASEPDARIRLATRIKNDQNPVMAQIIIEDEGHGFPDKHAADIFKPFFTNKSKGTGLGLTNVKRIVEAHGGWVTAENRQPKGAVFKVVLPMENDYGENTHR